MVLPEGSLDILTRKVFMKDMETFKVNGEYFSTHFDLKGNIQKIVFVRKTFQPPMKYTLYEINGEAADVSEVTGKKKLSLKLASKETSGTLSILPGREIKIHLEPDKKNVANNVSLVLSFPLTTEFHIPEHVNLGRKIDSEMPTGEWYSTSRYSEEFRYMRGLGYNFFLANSEGMWIRFRTKQPNLRSTSLHISRHPEFFIATFTWNVADDAFISVFSSMDEAIKDYEAWLEKETGARKLRNRLNLPEWVHNVKLVLIIDMLRSNWEIAHDYEDVANLASNLKKIGCPKDTLFYIPGWNGAYDSTYPTYRPHPELGGEEKMREMIETLHKNGFKVMIHTNAWGVDPYHPNIDELEKYVFRDEEGKYWGWGGIGIPFSPGNRPLKFRTDKIQFSGPGTAKSFSFQTVPVPDSCEAFMTIGNLATGDARVKFTINRRSIMTPPSWFRDHEEYAFPFPFLLQPGVNKVDVEVMGTAEPNWSKGWYKIRSCFIPTSPYSTWTHPILQADVNNQEWIKIFVDEVALVVKEYNIDAVHVDATAYVRAKRLLDTLKQKLPDTPLGTEGFGSLQEMGFWTFSQHGKQSLIDYSDVMQGTSDGHALPDRSGIEELYSWLNKPSPVSNFVRDYIYVYAHLCAADAFVPTGKVCQTFPPRLSPRCSKELWNTLSNAHKLNYIPTLRLNYRKFGIDEDTKKAIREIAQA